MHLNTCYLHIMIEKKEIAESIVDEESGGKRQKIVEQLSNEDHGRNVSQGKQNRTTEVNPHLFLHVVKESSERHFLTNIQSDTAEFMSWLLKTLHADLRGSENSSNMFYQCFKILLDFLSF